MEKFCYLESFVIEDGSSCHEVKMRYIALGKEAFNKKRSLMWRSLSLNLKVLFGIVLYGSETCTLQKEDIRRLEASKILIWRLMMKVMDRTQNK